MAPWNAVLRFFLEIVALVGIGAGGWRLGREVGGTPWAWVLASGVGWWSAPHRGRRFGSRATLGTHRWLLRQ